MLNMDVVGYQASGINDVGIYTDNVNTELTQFLRVLVDGYLNYGRRDVRCGYGEFTPNFYRKFLRNWLTLTRLCA